MRVWIDQDLCTGDGLCVDHCPDVFAQLEDGIAYVVEGQFVLNDPGGGRSLAKVAPRNEQDVIHAALTCPGECIFIEVQQSLPPEGRAA
jgi:ferredoxin